MPRGAPQRPGATEKPSGAEGKWLGAGPESRGYDPSGMGRTPNVAGRAPRQKGCTPRRVWVRKSRAGRAPCHFSAPENHPGRTKSLMPDTPKVKSHAPNGGRSCWRHVLPRLDFNDVCRSVCLPILSGRAKNSKAAKETLFVFVFSSRTSRDRRLFI